MTVYIPGAEPLFIEGNTRGCLLLHGAGGGSAWDQKEFANILHGKTGMTVWLPSITGFGTKPEDLFGVTLNDWLADAHSGLDRLLETCQQVFLVGHSAGGLLALLTASERNEVDGLVTWAAPYNVQSRLFSLLPVMSRIPFLRRAIPERHESPAPRWLREKGWVGYDWIPTSIGPVMHDALKRLKQALNSVTCPALIIQGTADGSVSRNSAQRIFNNLASERKEMYMIEGAPHPIMTDDRYKDDLFARTIEFLKGIE
ncbi:MAG: alpha/beta fold hydrolase [Candidatus Thorarchaeota archaeon]|nr:alpha/beta fold hydrolase [Candidatus Thorarchaeota archaeon]